MTTAFFSYSHKDEAVRDELEIHLSMLKRQNMIESWHDRRILAGDDWRGEISQHLERADIILLLVSPYFIASNYCYDVEMGRALERHASGESRVMPVILDPCDWHPAPFGKLQAVPKDGKPISKFPNRHDAFLEVVQAVRSVLEKLNPSKAFATTAFAGPQTKPSAPVAVNRTSNLRVKKNFTDHDRDTFLDTTFEFLSNFFENSLAELEDRTDGITCRFRRISANHFTASIYLHGKSVSECGIRLGDAIFGRQILYSHDSSSTNSSNESLSIEDDGHSMFLRPRGFSRVANGRGKDQLSQQGAAELYWAMLIDPLQR